jgi:glycosyltransferase involved in cell wall biosynthesis
MADYAPGITRDAKRETVLFLILGSIERTKGQDVLVHALKHLDKGVIEKAEFTIIGSSNDSDVMSLCESAAVEYGNFAIYDSIPREELRKWYEKADCLIIPSREDTVSLVGVEAAMFSVPIISSDSVGLAGYLEHNETGLVFPSEDCKALAENIAFAIDNRDKMAEMGRKARKEVY